MVLRAVREGAVCSTDACGIGSGDESRDDRAFIGCADGARNVVALSVTGAREPPYFPARKRQGEARLAALRRPTR